MLDHEQGNAWFDDVNTANISLEHRKGNTSRNAFAEAALHFGQERFLWSELLKFIRALNSLFPLTAMGICPLKSQMQNGLLWNCLQCNLLLNL